MVRRRRRAKRAGVPRYPVSERLKKTTAIQVRLTAAQKEFIIQAVKLLIDNGETRNLTSWIIESLTAEAQRAYLKYQRGIAEGVKEPSEHED